MFRKKALRMCGKLRTLEKLLSVLKRTLDKVLDFQRTYELSRCKGKALLIETKNGKDTKKE